MEDEKYIYIKYYSAEIKIKGNDLIDAVKKNPVYEDRINDLKKKIYENMKIHPSFQHFSEGDHYVLYNIESGNKIILYDYRKIRFKTEYDFSFNIISKQSETIYELKDKIAEKYKIPANHQNWVFNNIKLDKDYLTIFDYDQENNGELLKIGTVINIYIKEKPNVNLYIVNDNNINVEISIDIFDTIEKLYQLYEMKIGKKVILGVEFFLIGEKYLSKMNSMIIDYDFSKNNNIIQLVKCPFCIFVKAYNTTIHLVCKPSDTITKIIQMIQEETDLSIDNPKIIYLGKQLEDDKTLDDYNIKTLSILYVVNRLR